MKSSINFNMKRQIIFEIKRLICSSYEQMKSLIRFYSETFNKFSCVKRDKFSYEHLNKGFIHKTYKKNFLTGTYSIAYNFK